MWSTTIVATTVPIVSPGVVSPSAVGVDSLTVVRASSTPASAELGSTMAHLESSPHSSSNDTLSRNTNEMEHGVRDSMPSPALVSLESVSRQSSTECDVAHQQSVVCSNMHPMVTRTMAETLRATSSFYFDDKWKFSRKESLPKSRSSSFSSSYSSSSSSSKRCAFTRKCARVLKQQRARFYIMRRCVAMLICGHD
ncbi:hypothetical protein V6N12_045363 [Hibiscus sabdariffa]|uniref:Uncharacterized protein n=1 Tax=Hibiscus sabdariffa TaxID=183260 RepID=A0ABR2G2I3_9ROSI